jgi:hypothetical protein
LKPRPDPNGGGLDGEAELRRHREGNLAGQRAGLLALANGEGGGGNVQLHKGNRSNIIDPGLFSLQEWQMCGDMMHP